MKELRNYEMAIHMNDYKVNLVVTDNYEVVSITAAEEIKETKKHTYKVKDEVKLTKTDKKFLEENLREEFIPFEEDDDIEE